MILGWLTSRRFFNELAMAGLANPVDQWVGAKCDNVLLNFAPSDKNIKVISFSVFQIFHETSMFLDHSKTNAKSQRILNSQARGLLCISDG